MLLKSEALTKINNQASGVQSLGRLQSANGILVAKNLKAPIGELVGIGLDQRIPAEVVGFEDDLAQLMPFGPVDHMVQGGLVIAAGHPMRLPFGTQLLGRVLSGLGEPMDGAGPLSTTRTISVNGSAPQPMSRNRINKPFATGVRVIDGLLTVGIGQRVALFSGSGVGKSTLLGQLANNSEADVVVLAMVGERGREVRPFIEDCLGTGGLDNSVVFVATSEQPPLMRVRAAESAVSVATEFRAMGKNVLLLIDSLTRFATAQREIGLLLGEPPSARGFTPSVFSSLARLLERLGSDDRGSITSIMTVLVDGDDLDEPVSDCIRSIVDGHIVLDRQLAEAGNYPAVNVAKSISRVMWDVASEQHLKAATNVRGLKAAYEEVADLLRIGAYVPGNLPRIDAAIQLMPAYQKFVRQGNLENTPFSTTVDKLLAIAKQWTFDEL